MNQSGRLPKLDQNQYQNRQDPMNRRSISVMRASFSNSPPVPFYQTMDRRQAKKTLRSSVDELPKMYNQLALHWNHTFVKRQDFDKTRKLNQWSGQIESNLIAKTNKDILEEWKWQRANIKTHDLIDRLKARRTSVLKKLQDLDSNFEPEFILKITDHLYELRRVNMQLAANFVSLVDRVPHYDRTVSDALLGQDIKLLRCREYFNIRPCPNPFLAANSHPMPFLTSTRHVNQLMWRDREEKEMAEYLERALKKRVRKDYLPEPSSRHNFLARKTLSSCQKRLEQSFESPAFKQLKIIRKTPALLQQSLPQVPLQRQDSPRREMDLHLGPLTIQNWDEINSLCQGFAYGFPVDKFSEKVQLFEQGFDHFKIAFPQDLPILGVALVSISASSLLQSHNLYDVHFMRSKTKDLFMNHLKELRLFMQEKGCSVLSLKNANLIDPDFKIFREILEGTGEPNERRSILKSTSKKSYVPLQIKIEQHIKRQRKNNRTVVAGYVQHAIEERDFAEDFARQSGEEVESESQSLWEPRTIILPTFSLLSINNKSFLRFKSEMKKKPTKEVKVGGPAGGETQSNASPDRIPPTEKRAVSTVESMPAEQAQASNPSEAEVQAQNQNDDIQQLIQAKPSKQFHDKSKSSMRYEEEESGPKIDQGERSFEAEGGDSYSSIEPQPCQVEENKSLHPPSLGKLPENSQSKLDDYSFPEQEQQEYSREVTPALESPPEDPAPAKEEDPMNKGDKEEPIPFLAQSKPMGQNISEVLSHVPNGSIQNSKTPPRKQMHKGDKAQASSGAVSLRKSKTRSPSKAHEQSQSKVNLLAASLRKSQTRSPSKLEVKQAIPVPSRPVMSILNHSCDSSKIIFDRDTGLIVLPPPLTSQDYQVIIAPTLAPAPEDKASRNRILQKLQALVNDLRDPINLKYAFIPSFNVKMKKTALNEVLSANKEETIWGTFEGSISLIAGGPSMFRPKVKQPFFGENSKSIKNFLYNENGNEVKVRGSFDMGVLLNGRVLVAVKVDQKQWVTWDEDCLEARRLQVLGHK